MIRRTFCAFGKRQYSTMLTGSTIASALQIAVKKRIDTPTLPSPSTAVVPLDTSPIAIAKILDSDPATAMRILEKLSPDRRRYLLVAATASEWYGPTQVSAEVDKADVDGDQRISPNEYLSFIEQSVGAKQAIPWRTLLLVALQAGAPFVAFGFLDNSLMILSGDAIDNAFGERLALSAMGAAALGGICSGALGVQFHGVTQRIVARILPVSLLATSTHQAAKVRAVSHLGMTAGIAMGLCLGMTPLLFVDSHHVERDKENRANSSLVE